MDVLFKKIGFFKDELFRFIMKIRVINESDWERTYDLEKSIIRVGSQISCDIQLSGNDIQPMLMQFVRSGGKEVKYVLRIFGDNVRIARGEQTYIGQQMTPYDVLDGDKLIFGSYRMIVSLEDEQTRIRTTKNMEAKMYIQKRELGVDSPIHGTLRLKNTGTKRACQFRLQIRGIPDECLLSAPLPYLYPGGQSTVGFVISHLQTKPLPGFHTVSIILTAPDEYFGETLEFRQDIYVNPVFKNEITLEDDSAELSGFNKIPDDMIKQPEASAQGHSLVLETSRMIPGQAVIEKDEPDDGTGNNPVVISGTDKKNAFDEVDYDDSEDGNRRRRSKRKQKVNVIRHDDVSEHAFEDAEEDSEDVPAEDETMISPEEKAEEVPDAVPAETSEAADEPENEERRRRSNREKKVNVIRYDDDSAEHAFDGADKDRENVPAETETVVPAEEKAEPAPEAVPEEIPEASAEPENEDRRRTSKRKQKVNVIRFEDDSAEHAFDDPEKVSENVPAETVISAEKKAGPEAAPADSQEVPAQPEEEDRRRSKRKQKANVIRYDKNSAKHAFEDPEKVNENVPAETVISAEEKSEPAAEAAPMDTPEESAETEDVPVRAVRSSGRKRKAASEAEEKPVPVSENPEPEPAMKESSELQTASEPEKMTESPETKPEEVFVLDSGSGLQSVEEQEGPAEVFEPEPAEETEQPAAEPGPAAEPETEEEQPEIPEEGSPDAAGSENEADAGPEEAVEEQLPIPENDQETNADAADGRLPAEEPEASDVESEARSIPEETEDQPEITEGHLPEAEAVSASDEETEKPSEVPQDPADEGPETENIRTVITGSGTAPIPVIHHNGSFDFVGEDEQSAPSPEKEPAVRFVKRGNFDE